jgi:steroid delta-isomerase-like uncharacterized protein
MTGERRLFFERYIDAWNDHDPDAVVAQFGPSGTYVDSSLDSPLAREEVADFVNDTLVAFPDVEFSERRVISEDSSENLVLTTEWTMIGTHAGSFQGLPPTGEQVEIEGVDVITVTDEGITSITGYFDQSEVMAQLGLTFPTVIGKIPTLAVGAVRETLS